MHSVLLYVYLIVLSACALLSSSTQLGDPTAEMKQLTLADVNQATEQQELAAVRLARQLGFGRRFGRFGPGGGFGGGGGGGGFGPGPGFGGGGFGGRRFLGRRRFANPGFFPQPLGFFG
ncbi:keratin, type II cytoskeletal 2 epidermal [Drosophila nasuta]|uniref:keratin, type II cytoskeletal 2 epidermal n=1 Tax=Drosophila nasuta TaxID=42062 RepID=UPI00295F3F0E|nr:keratin, type II cytoskeletal 2 epidermal [Drosophila nasuta]